MLDVFEHQRLGPISFGVFWPCPTRKLRPLRPNLTCLSHVYLDEVNGEVTYGYRGAYDAYLSFVAEATIGDGGTGYSFEVILETPE